MSVTPVITTNSRGGDRPKPWYLNEARGDSVQELEIDMPIRDRDGQRVSRGYMRELAEHPDSPNNLLYEKIREQLIVEWEED